MISEDSGSSGLEYFLYRSFAAPDLGANDLRNIVTTARSRNQQSRLTGALHHEDGLFFQWLEGSSHQLWPVVDSIRKDVRHRDLTVLKTGQQTQRRFDGWAMRYSDRDDASLLDWFARHDISTFDPAIYATGVMGFLATI